MAKQYPDDPQQAAEYVRLALPFMAQYGIPTTPPHYRVWYDYVSGRNSKLKETVDRALNVRAAINADFSTKLYEEYVEHEGDRIAEQMREEVYGLLSGTLERITESGERTAHYETVLKEYTDRLSINPGRDHVRRTVNDLLAETKSMQASNQKLEQRLKQTTEELVTLREELDLNRGTSDQDGLTGIASRAQFNISLNSAVISAQASGQDLSVIVADVDNFNTLNQKHGHLIGDKVLRFVATHIHDSVKGTDLAARFGGEEFAVLLPNTPLSGGLTLAEKIRANLETQRLRRTDTEESVGKVTLSLGVAGFRGGEDARSLLQRAIDAMERAKHEGRNRACCETHRS